MKNAVEAEFVDLPSLVNCQLIDVIVSIQTVKVQNAGKMKEEMDARKKPVTVSSAHDLKNVSAGVGVIVVDSGCCNDSGLRELDFSRFRNLREVRVGDDCFANVKDVSMTGLKKLEKVEFGKNCCCQASGGSFEVKECERLKSVKIGDGCFVKVRVVVFIGGCIVVLLRIDLPVLKTVDLGNDSFTGEVKLVMKSGN